MKLMSINGALLFMGAYLIGSIPTGYVVAKFAGIADIRQYGSGNTGATNVARVLGIQWFFLVLFIDALKAYWYMRYVQQIILSDKSMCGIALGLLFGNIFSIFLGFRGGKGVATSVGIVAALMPGVWGYVLGIWLTALAITQTVGIASVIGCIALPIVTVYYYGVFHAYWYLSMIISASIFVTHRENIARFVQNLSF